jgi:5-methylthioadenosine/S-adenosylhomocysteine deaminase
MPVLAHVSESRDECEWIAGRNKAIDDFHEIVRRARGADKVQDSGEKPKWTGKGATPVEHLERYGLLDERLLLAHAVHITDSDLALLEKHQCKVAHCPRSNAKLRNGLAALDKLRARVTVGLGTDSLASCDDLNIRHEAQYALNAHRSFDPQFSATARDFAAMATIEAARAIGMDNEIGSLEPGKLADIAIFGLDSRQASDNPYDLFLHGPCRLSDLVVGGSFVVRRGRLVKP